MERAMQERGLVNTRTSEASFIFGKAHRLKIPFLILSLAPLLAIVVVVGIVRFFQSLSDDSISAWRLLVLFAHILGCVMIVTALYNRGRRSRSYHLPRGRAL
jgi:hypothetical protein